MVNIFDPIIDRQKGALKAASWYRNAVSTISGRAGARTLMRSGKLNARPSAGRLNFYFYDPKGKKTLPYYDIFPLVIPIKPYNGGRGVLGMNFHYLPYRLRENLMKKLIGYLNEEELEAYLDVSYNDIKGFTRYKEAKPTLHKYDLTGSYVRSQFIHIEPNEWTTALHLPVEEFRSRGGGMGVTKAEVWGDSKEIIEQHSTKNGD